MARHKSEHALSQNENTSKFANKRRQENYKSNELIVVENNPNIAKSDKSMISILHKF